MAAAVCERREMLLTNHALVIAALARDAGLRVRELAERVGVTERAVETIVGDLERAGYLSRRRRGRRNVYEVHAERPLQHPLLGGLTLGHLLAGMGGEPAEPASPKPASGNGQNPEFTVSCAETGVMTILGATGHTPNEEGTASRALIYAVIVSVLVLSTAASALALMGRTVAAAGTPGRTPALHLIPAVATEGPASDGSGHTTLMHRTSQEPARSGRRTTARRSRGRRTDGQPGQATTGAASPSGSGQGSPSGGQAGATLEVGGTTVGVTLGSGRATVKVAAHPPAKLPVKLPVKLPAPPPVTVSLP